MHSGSAVWHVHPLAIYPGLFHPRQSIAPGATVDDAAAVPLDTVDLAAIRSYVERIGRLETDSKLVRLLLDVDEARSSRHSRRARQHPQTTLSPGCCS